MTIMEWVVVFLTPIFVVGHLYIWHRDRVEKEEWRKLEEEEE